MCFACIYVCSSCACLVIIFVRSGGQIPQNWSCGWLLATMWSLRTEQTQSLCESMGYTLLSLSPSLPTSYYHDKPLNFYFPLFSLLFLNFQFSNFYSDLYSLPSPCLSKMTDLNFFLLLFFNLTMIYEQVVVFLFPRLFSSLFIYCGFPGFFGNLT